VRALLFRWLLTGTTPALILEKEPESLAEFVAKGLVETAHNSTGMTRLRALEMLRVILDGQDDAADTKANANVVHLIDRMTKEADGQIKRVMEVNRTLSIPEEVSEETENE